MLPKSFALIVALFSFLVASLPAGAAPANRCEKNRACLGKSVSPETGAPETMWDSHYNRYKRHLAAYLPRDIKATRGISRCFESGEVYSGPSLSQSEMRARSITSCLDLTSRDGHFRDVGYGDQRSGATLYKEAAGGQWVVWARWRDSNNLIHASPEAVAFARANGHETKVVNAIPPAQSAPRATNPVDNVVGQAAEKLKSAKEALGGIGGLIKGF
jgi:hypothetical protein